MFWVQIRNAKSEKKKKESKGGVEVVLLLEITLKKKRGEEAKETKISLHNAVKNMSCSDSLQCSTKKYCLCFLEKKISS